MQWYELGPFTIFDLETTGMNPVSDRIVEIAALRIELTGQEVVFHHLIHPGRRIPPAVTRIHHITDEMVAAAPRFQEIAPDFLNLARGSTLVAHNARFDLGFLQESLCRHGLPLWNGKTLDSLKLVRRMCPGLPSYSLQNLRRTLALDEAADDLAAHRAGDDVVWTMRLLKKLLTKALESEAAGQ